MRRKKLPWSLLFLMLGGILITIGLHLNLKLVIYVVLGLITLILLGVSMKLGLAVLKLKQSLVIEGVMLLVVMLTMNSIDRLRLDSEPGFLLALMRFLLVTLSWGLMLALTAKKLEGLNLFKISSLFPEDWRCNTNEKLQRLQKAGYSQWYIRLATFQIFLELIWAAIEVAWDNLWLPRNRNE